METFVQLPSCLRLTSSYPPSVVATAPLPVGAHISSDQGFFVLCGFSQLGPSVWNEVKEGGRINLLESSEVNKPNFNSLKKYVCD